MLAKPLAEKRREGGRKRRGNRTSAGLYQLVFLKFLRTAFASASPASCLLAKSTSLNNRPSCRTEPGSLNRYRQTVFPDRYLRLKAGISSLRLPRVGGCVQPAGRPQLLSQLRYASRVMIHRRPRRTSGAQ